MKSQYLSLMAVAAFSMAACQQDLAPSKDAGSTGTGGSGGSNGAGTGGATSGTGGATSGTGGSVASTGGTVGTDAGTDVPAIVDAPAEAGGGESVMDIFGMKNEFNEYLADSFFIWPCYSNVNQDCITIPPGSSCPTPDPKGSFEEQGLVKNETFKVGGVPGKMYLATIRVNGISEGKYYQNGTRAAGDGDVPNAQSDNGTDTFYTGGSAIYQEFYNVYSIRVQDTTGKELQHYYLNSFPKTGNVQYEDHWTFAISYTHDIPVMGGGTIVYHASDINCHAIDNCGNATTSQTCPLSQGRKVPNEPNLVLPATYMGKTLASLNYRTGATQPWHSHIIHVTFTDVKPM